MEQLRQESACSGDSEQLEFERVMGELERVLQKAVVRLREQPFTIALCGTVDADKSLFLNALVGRAIFPLDGESYDPRMLHPMLSTTAELPSTAWPCRFRHVEGQKCPVLQFQAEPFLVALKELQARQYSRKMQSYQPPPEDMFEGPLLSDALSDPSDEAILLGMIHSQWVSLHAVTRDNLLKFETPGFELPRGAHGDLNVKTLVGFVSCWKALCSTEYYLQLGQLNDIVRLCQRFDIKFDMSESDWPLLTVEFNSLRSHPMDGIYEVGRDARRYFQVADPHI